MGTAAKVLLGSVLVIVALASLSSLGRSTGELNPTNTAPAQTSASGVMTWYQNSGAAGMVTRLSADMRAIIAAGDATSMSAMRRACEQFQTDVAALAVTLPSPAEDLTQALRSALDHYTLSARLCISGVTGTLADLPRASSELRAGTLALSGAVAAMKQYR